MSDIITVDDTNFEKEVIQSLVPVVLDFGAPWCGPCQKQMPILVQFAAQHNKRLKVCKVDVDDAPSLAAAYNIKSVPAILIFFQGKRVGEKIGLTNAAVLDKMVTDLTGR